MASHGTRTRYTSDRCRCGACREAMAAYSRNAIAPRAAVLLRRYCAAWVQQNQPDVWRSLPTTRPSAKVTAAKRWVEANHPDTHADLKATAVLQATLERGL